MSKKSIKSNPVVTARKALEDVLSRAIKSKDDERIVSAASKVLQQFPESETHEPGSGGVVGRDAIDLMTPEEKAEVRSLLDRALVLRAKAMIRNGVKPAFMRPLLPEHEARILEAAREELRDEARRAL